MSEAMSHSRSEETQAGTEQGQETATRGGPRVPAPRRPSTAPTGARASLTSETGTTRIADTVVAKIAALATREIPGVHSMGRGFSRRMGQLRAMVPGQTEEQATAQGVSVEVGEKEAAVDLDIVTFYGESIAEVADSVRQNVIDRLQGMTGLHVVEVNINVDDLFVEGEQPAEEESRVS